ncbi:MAG: vWA domain-containing protein [Blastocatellia bacterium]|nr:vWA domain-containing protein [Blastocatellia bacterium]
MFVLLQPIWLVLAIPLAAGWWLWRPASRWVRHLRLAVLALILLALCGPALRVPRREGTIVVLADRSRSMPATSETSEKEAIELIQRAMSRDDRLAVIAFGETSAIERAPQTGAFAGFTAEIGRDASSLGQAIEKALALIPPDAPGRIFVLSDGRWTGQDPAAVAARAAARGIAIDYRALQRSTANDLAIAELDAPVTVMPGEAFMLTAWVKSPVAQEISYELRRGAQLLAAGKTRVTASAGGGLNRLTFRDLAGDPGAQSYTIRVTGPGEDPVPENNSAKALIGVAGPRPLLLVTESRASGLARLLAAGGLKVVAAPPAECDWSLDALARYSGVILENVPAEAVTTRGMESIAAWINDAGAGMMMTGGRRAYGPGGYFKSPLEPLMPVSMELRMEHRKLALAIVVAMDRSGSMGVSVGEGRTKMDLANLAAVQVLDMLSPMDEFGVVAVDSASHIITELKPVEALGNARQQILKVDSGGGGIFVFEALTTAAEMLLKAKSGTRHIILFADAADAEEPGQYQDLLRQCEQAGITVSVIGLGTPADADAGLLRDVAQRGSGQIFFTESAADLPRLFAQDTIIVARSMFLDQPTPIQFTGGLATLTGRQFAGLDSVGGYNLCYLRPKANLAAVTLDEYQSPLVASWQAGSGRVLCYLGEADGQFTGAMASWKEAGEFFASLSRWTAGATANLPDGMLVTQELRNGVSRIRLHLDPERDAASASLNSLPTITTLRGAPGRPPKSEKAEMRWESADTLLLDLPLQGSETALSTVELPGGPRLTLAPVALPYSPEFKPAGTDEGLPALARLAQATNGRERLDLSGIWKDLPRQPRMIDLAPWLLGIAIFILLLEVLERHTGLLSAKALPTLQRLRLPAIRAPRPRKKAVASPAPIIAESAPPPDGTETPPEPAAILDALQEARRKAGERTRR